jgi:hypothetical protein
MVEPYWIEDGEDWFGCTLKGPRDFECTLGEPEDRNWYRDGADAVERLNEQHQRIVELDAEVKRLREALEGVREAIQFRLDDGIGGCTQTELEEWVHTLHTALKEEA